VLIVGHDCEDELTAEPIENVGVFVDGDETRCSVTIACENDPDAVNVKFEAATSLESAILVQM
jgi:hypothetical protein